jgi:threonine/homoserine/homoserine lactone efflux protein
MDIGILYKVILFWGIFYVTPGPVWVSVMEATRRLSYPQIAQFFFKVFFPVNITVQFSQALVCVAFIEVVSKYFSQIDLLFYILGGLYISYLAYKTIKSKQANSAFELSFINLAMIMLLSPKIWLLFPSGAVIANQLTHSTVTNALIFGLSMLIVSSIMFVFYILIGKLGTRLLKDNFSYLAFGLLLLFAMFLFNEAYQVGFDKFTVVKS